MPNRPSQTKPIDFSLLMRAKSAPAARSGAPASTRTGIKRPSAPKHLSEAARAVWRRTVREMVAAGAWKPAYGELLSLYAELRALFDAGPGSFSPTKLVTLRLLTRDLGLSPGTIGAPMP